MSEEYIVNYFEQLLLNSPPKFLNVELKKMRKNLKRRIWRCENREKQNEKFRKYRKENPEKERARNRKYRKENPEKGRERSRKWQNENPEKVRERNRKYEKANRKKRTDEMRKWRDNNPEKNKKTSKKATWKSMGLNMENFGEIYERYINTTHCDHCEVLLTLDKITTKTTRVMDHSHCTGDFRNVLCHSCNGKLPKHT